MKCDFCASEATRIGDDTPPHPRRLFAFCDVHYHIFLSAYQAEAVRHPDKTQGVFMMGEISKYMVSLKSKKGKALLAKRLVDELRWGGVYDW